jgi:hypothetical protein
MRVLANDENKSQSLINLSEDPSQVIQLNEQVINVEEKANNNAVVDKRSEITLSAI